MNEQSNTLDINYLRLVFDQLGTDAFLNNYKKLADVFPALVYVFDADKKKVGYVNKQFSSLLGYSDDDLLGFEYDWTKVVFKDDVARFNEELEKFYTLEDDASYSYENRLNNKTGGWKYFRTNGTILRRNSDGKPQSLLFIAQDITEQLHNSDELKRTKEVILETERLHQFGMYSYNVEQDLYTWSDGIYRLFDLEKESVPVINQAFFSSFVLSDDKGTLETIRNRDCGDISDFENEFSIQTAEGEIKILLDLSKVVCNDEGKVIKYVGSLRDVTQQRLYERELQRRIRDLDSSNKELEEFAYVASHDLQEPLRKITTFSTRLKDKFADVIGNEGRMYIERMNVAATNMRILIENLLEISRTSRNEQPFYATDLNNVLEQVSVELDLGLEEQKVHLEVEKNLPVIEAVPSMMVQLFSNLLNNAIKFHSEKPPEISVKSRLLDRAEREALLLPEKAFYEIAVKDNGIGFEPEFQEKVFHIFQRLHGKAEYPGSGIGLSICKKIADKHGGLIYAKSQPGEGATFFIVLPEKQ